MTIDKIFLLLAICQACHAIAQLDMVEKVGGNLRLDRTPLKVSTGEPLIKCGLLCHQHPECRSYSYQDLTSGMMGPLFQTTTKECLLFDRPEGFKDTKTLPYPNSRFFTVVTPERAAITLRAVYETCVDNTANIVVGEGSCFTNGPAQSDHVTLRHYCGGLGGHLAVLDSAELRQKVATDPKYAAMMAAAGTPGNHGLIVGLFHHEAAWPQPKGWGWLDSRHNGWRPIHEVFGQPPWKPNQPDGQTGFGRDQQALMDRDGLLYDSWYYTAFPPLCQIWEKQEGPPLGDNS